MLLYKLLKSNPEWLFNAYIHGWTHPVVTSLGINDTTNPYLDVNLSADYRLQFVPRNAAGQALTLTWGNSAPEVIAAKRITRFEFTVLDNVPTLQIQLDRHELAFEVTHPDGSLALPVTWDVVESHEGLWRACYSRTFENGHVGNVTQLTT